MDMKKYKSHYAALLRLGIPILLGQMGVILVGFIDTMMVGQYSTLSLAAASFVNSLFTFIIVLCLGFSYGLTPIVGGLFSRGEFREAGVVTKNALVLNSLFGTLAIGAMVIVYFNLDKFGQPKDLLPLMRPYYIIILVSVFFVVCFNVLRQFADGITNTSLSMWVIIGGNIINIIFNYLLIFGKYGFPELGLAGAGLSTLFARIMMVCVFISVLMMKKSYKEYRAGFRSGKISYRRIMEVNRTSWPVALQMGMETGLFTFSAIMIGWLGAIPLASFQVIGAISTLGFLAYYSIGASVAIKVSNHMGVNDIVNVKLAAVAGYHIMLVLAFVVSVLFYFCGSWIISWFTKDPAVITASLALILPLILYQFGDATQINFANALRGTSYVMPMLWIALLSYVCVGLPIGYLLGFPFDMGVVGIFLSFSIALFLAGGLFIYQFYKRVN